MSMFLLLPVGLAALAALLLPLLVHLARRSEPRTVPFAALRWLRALPQPRRKHRFEELLLLLLRLLLLAALAVLLAQPMLFGRPDRRPWVVVAPGADAVAARAVPNAKQSRWHWLAPGFPDIGQAEGLAAMAAPTTLTSLAGASFASLLRELDAQLPAGTPLMVVVPDTIDGADAQRPVLSRKVDWRIVPSSPSAATTTDRRTTNTTPSALQVRYAPDRAASLRYLRAAGAAWAADAPAPIPAISDPSFRRKPESSASDAAKEAGPRLAPGRQAEISTPANRVVDAPIAQPLASSTRNLVWLAPGAVPAAIRDWVASGGTVLLDADARWSGPDRDTPVVWRDDDGPLARGARFGRGRVLRLERPLLPASMPGLLEPDFPQQLRELFAEAPPAPARVAARDYAPRTGVAAYPERPRPLSPWLIWLVAALFALERWVASGRRRSAAA